MRKIILFFMLISCSLFNYNLPNFETSNNDFSVTDPPPHINVDEFKSIRLLSPLTEIPPTQTTVPVSINIIDANGIASISIISPLPTITESLSDSPMMHTFTTNFAPTVYDPTRNYTRENPEFPIEVRYQNNAGQTVSTNFAFKKLIPQVEYTIPPIVPSGSSIDPTIKINIHPTGAYPASIVFVNNATSSTAQGMPSDSDPNVWEVTMSSLFPGGAAFFTPLNYTITSTTGDVQTGVFNFSRE